MCSKELLLLMICITLLGGLRLTSTTTTTTFVAAMSMANQDLERYFRTANATHTYASLIDERIALDIYNYAFLSYSYMNPELVPVSYEEEQARYGEGVIMSVTGKLVHISNVDDVSDDYACSSQISGTMGTEIPMRNVSWIALVRRGRCTFEDKVKHVHAKGAIGVIVYNDKVVMNLEKMQIKGRNRNITAVITYQKIGIELANIVDKHLDVNISITEGQHGTRPLNSLNRTSVLFVSISFIVLMIISLVWLIFYYIQRFRYLQAKDQQSRTLCSVTKKAIMKIPTKTGKMTDEKDVDSDCCAICIEAYRPSDIIRILPCNHEFHKTCIDPWLIEHRTCPMCKLDVLRFYGYVVGDQLQQTPSPNHQPPNNLGTAAAAAAAVVSSDDDDNNLPVIVVSMSAQPPPPPQSFQARGTLSSSPSAAAAHQTLEQPNNIHQQHPHQFNHSHSNSNSNNSNGNGNDANTNNINNNNNNNQSIVDGNIVRRNSAPAIVLEVSTASRQVTDV